MPSDSQAGIEEEKLASCHFRGHRACGSVDTDTQLSEQPAAIPPVVVAAPKPDRLTPRAKHTVSLKAHIRESFSIFSSVTLLSSTSFKQTPMYRTEQALCALRHVEGCCATHLLGPSSTLLFPLSLQQPGLFLPAPRSKRDPRLPSYSAKPGTPLLAPRVARAPYCRTPPAAQHTSLKP